MQPLQSRDKVFDAGHAVSFAAQPADEFEAQLCGEASQVAEAHLLQEVAGVTPEHHIDVHVLCTLHVPTDRNEHEKKERQSGNI